MKLLYTLSKDNFPTRNFKGGKDLNDHCEYPYYPNKGMWLSPAIETETGVTSPWKLEMEEEDDTTPTKIYTLNENAKLFHFRTVNDYVNAYGMFPLFLTLNEPDQYETELEGENYVKKSLCKLMDSYHKFSTWKAEISGNTIPETGIKFSNYDGDNVDLRFTIEANGDINFSQKDIIDIVSYEQCENNSGKDGILLLTQICAYILRRIKHYSKCIRPSLEDTIIGIDYNAMRSAGYKGFFVHRSAVEEARNVKEGSSLHDIIDPLLYWSPETVCVWNYCFEE